MNKNFGYSIRYREESMLVMGVSDLEHGRWHIDHLEENQAAAGPSASLAKELLKKPEHLTLMVPGAEVRTSLIELPKLKKKEMGVAASGWVARDEVSTPDQWRVSWRVRQDDSGPEKKNMQDVFLLYAPVDDVNHQMSLAESWGGKPQRMLPDFMILDTMFRRYHPDAKDLTAWNVIFVGKEDHFLCVSSQSSMLLTRQLPADLSDGSDAEEYLERLATEVDRSIFFARQTQFNPDIQRIVVCGDPQLAKGLIERLKNETTVPAQYWDISECFEWERGPLDSRLLMPAMAAALSHSKNPFNLLPDQPGNLLGPLARRRFVLAVSTAAAAMVPILLMGGLITADIQDRYLDQARVMLEDAGLRAEQAAEIYKAQRVLLSREEHISSFTDKEADYSGVLLHLASLTPEQIIYQDLRLKETGDGRLVLFLSGESTADTVAQAQESFLKFQLALQQSSVLVEKGEPRKLMISAETEKGETIKKVEFSMEYAVRFDTKNLSAVALLNSRTER